MKELKPIDNIYLEKYGVLVTPYLTDVQILVAGEALLGIDGYVERQICLASSILQFCTDLTEEEIKGMEYNLLVSSGLLQAVSERIINLDLVEKYVADQESVERQLKDSIAKVTQTLETLADNISNNEQLTKWGAVIKSKVESFIKENK